ncbi:MAG: hypothetical protein IIC30_05035 [Chloroflexi bacterium]|nr:hypothetical protein [Chloroflexota bacterium]
MIRITRTFTAKQGKRAELVDVLKEISGYAATQGVDIKVLFEPWGDSRRVYIHTDYEEADTALHFLEGLYENPKAADAFQRMDDLTDGDPEVAFLTSR